MPVPEEEQCKLVVAQTGLSEVWDKCQVLCYFGPSIWQGKENGPKECWFWELSLPSCLCCDSASLPACDLYLIISQYKPCLHHHIPHFLAVPIVIQGIQMLEGSFPITCSGIRHQACLCIWLWGRLLSKLCDSGTLCLLVSVLNHLWRQCHHF